MIMPQLIINTYVSLMYELKNKMERYLRVNLLGPGPRLMEKRIYRAAVSQRLSSAGLKDALRRQGAVETSSCD